MRAIVIITTIISQVFAFFYFLMLSFFIEQDLHSVKLYLYFVILTTTLLIYSAYVAITSFRKVYYVKLFPTSTILGMAIGPVKLKFEVTNPQIKSSSGISCAYYKYIVESYVSTGKKGHWSKIRETSSDPNITINDGTAEHKLNVSPFELDVDEGVFSYPQLLNAKYKVFTKSIDLPEYKIGLRARELLLVPKKTYYLLGNLDIQNNVASLKEGAIPCMITSLPQRNLINLYFTWGICSILIFLGIISTLAYLYFKVWSSYL